MQVLPFSRKACPHETRVAGRRDRKRASFLAPGGEYGGGWGGGMGRLWRFARGWVALCVILKKIKILKKIQGCDKRHIERGCGVG